MTDRISHWLQGGAVVIAGISLWFLSRKQTAGVIEQNAPASLPSAQALNFGGVSVPGIDPGSIYIGGNPIYTTYNFPPATPNPVGATADNSGGQAQAPFAVQPPASDSCCGSCSSQSQCQDNQLTVSGFSGAFEGRVPGSTQNLFSLNDKGQYQYI